MKFLLTIFYLCFEFWGASSQNVNFTFIPMDESQKPMKVLIHGWKDSPNVTWIKSFTDGYIKRSHPVLQVDWSSLASGDYLDVVSNVEVVGKRLGSYLIDLHNSDLEKIHIIAHSLGSHVAGYAGYEIKQKTSKKIARITGLDPAGPLVAPFGIVRNLRSSDAFFVDITHTSAKIFGYSASCGLVDFWPNFGTCQRGCYASSAQDDTTNALGKVLWNVCNEDDKMPSVFQVPWVGVNMSLVAKDGWDSYGCGHQRAWEYYLETIMNTSSTNGYACSSSACNSKQFSTSSFIRYGEDMPTITPAKPSDYYFATNDKPPYLIETTNKRF